VDWADTGRGRDAWQPIFLSLSFVFSQLYRKRPKQQLPSRKRFRFRRKRNTDDPMLSNYIYIIFFLMFPETIPRSLLIEENRLYQFRWIPTLSNELILRIYIYICIPRMKTMIGWIYKNSPGEEIDKNLDFSEQRKNLTNRWFITGRRLTEGTLSNTNSVELQTTIQVVASKVVRDWPSLPNKNETVNYSKRFTQIFKVWPPLNRRTYLRRTFVNKHSTSAIFHRP